MRAKLTPDATRGAGFAVIELSEINMRIAFEPELAIALSRASDGQCLGAQEWQEAEARLKPDNASISDYDNNILLLQVGPDIVDKLDTLDTYRLSLFPAAERPCALNIEGLVYSVMAGGQGMAGQKNSPEPAKVEVKQQIEEEIPVEPAATAPEEKLEMAKTAVVEHENKSNLPIILVVILILAIGGGAAFWYFNKQNQNPIIESSAPVAEAKATPVKEEAPNPLVVAKKHLKENKDPAKSLELAKKILAENSGANSNANAADAAFLLLEDAANGNNAEATLLLANYYSPANNSNKGTILPDARLAKELYEKANTLGQTEADKLLKELKQWADENAVKGNAEAKKIIDTWK